MVSITWGSFSFNFFLLYIYTSTFCSLYLSWSVFSLKGTISPWKVSQLSTSFASVLLLLCCHSQYIAVFYSCTNSRNLNPSEWEEALFHSLLLLILLYLSFLLSSWSGIGLLVCSPTYVIHTLSYRQILPHWIVVIYWIRVILPLSITQCKPQFSLVIRFRYIFTASLAYRPYNIEKIFTFSCKYESPCPIHPLYSYFPLS